MEFKKILHKRQVLFFSNGLLFLMVFLHFGIYKGIYIEEDLLSPLTLNTDSPVDLHELSFCEQESKQPTYWNPFQAVEYHYQVLTNKEEKTYSDCVIVETADSIFWKADFKPTTGNPEDYWGGTNSDEGPFMRPQVGMIFPNVVYFFVQYGLLGIWMFTILKPTKV